MRIALSGSCGVGIRKEPTPPGKSSFPEQRLCSRIAVALCVDSNAWLGVCQRKISDFSSQIPWRVLLGSVKMLIIKRVMTRGGLRVILESQAKRAVGLLLREGAGMTLPSSITCNRGATNLTSEPPDCLHFTMETRDLSTGNF